MTLLFVFVGSVNNAVMLFTEYFYNTFFHNCHTITLYFSILTCCWWQLCNFAQANSIIFLVQENPIDCH